ncbi:MAG: hypothetical protein GY696_08445 [Gammaproteobacteria bacterium]|nr:hypothetical protein [Gammaproteobacteria bacterium]
MTSMEILEAEQCPGGEESRGLKGLEEKMVQVDLAEQGAMATAGRDSFPPFR